MSVQSMVEMGKDFCSNFIQPFLEDIDRRSLKGGIRKLIPVLHNPHQNGRSSPPAVEHLEGVPF